jgi:hypothetical protein
MRRRKCGIVTVIGMVLSVALVTPVAAHQPSLHHRFRQRPLGLHDGRRLSRRRMSGTRVGERRAASGERRPATGDR